MMRPAMMLDGFLYSQLIFKEIEIDFLGGAESE
jgi:hypothetical protein